MDAVGRAALGILHQKIAWLVFQIVAGSQQRKTVNLGLMQSGVLMELEIMAKNEPPKPENHCPTI